MRSSVLEVGGVEFGGVRSEHQAGHPERQQRGHGAHHADMPHHWWALELQPGVVQMAGVPQCLPLPADRDGRQTRRAPRRIAGAQAAAVAAGGLRQVLDLQRRDVPVGVAARAGGGPGREPSVRGVQVQRPLGVDGPDGGPRARVAASC